MDGVRPVFVKVFVVDVPTKTAARAISYPATPTASVEAVQVICAEVASAALTSVGVPGTVGAVTSPPGLKPSAMLTAV